MAILRVEGIEVEGNEDEIINIILKLKRRVRAKVGNGMDMGGIETLTIGSSTRSMPKKELEKINDELRKAKILPEFSTGNRGKDAFNAALVLIGSGIPVSSAREPARTLRSQVLHVFKATGIGMTEVVREGTG